MHSSLPEPVWIDLRKTWAKRKLAYLREPETQERLVLRALTSREEWEQEDLLTEMSKGRKEPMTNDCLRQYICRIRARGIPLIRRTVYRLAA